MSSGHVDEDRYPYYVVEFINRGRKPQVKSIDVVVGSWIVYNEKTKKCGTKYPQVSHTEYEQYLQNFTSPLDDWKVFTCHIRGRAVTYEEAKEKAKYLNDAESALTKSSDESFSDVERQESQKIRQRQFLNEAKRFKSDILEKTNFLTPKVKGSLVDLTLQNNKNNFRKPSCSNDSGSLVDLPSQTYNCNFEKSSYSSNSYKSDSFDGRNFIGNMNFQEEERDDVRFNFEKQNACTNAVPPKPCRVVEKENEFGKLHQLITNKFMDIRQSQNEIIALLKSQGKELQNLKTLVALQHNVGKNIIVNTNELGKKFELIFPLQNMSEFNNFEKKLKESDEFQLSLKILLQSQIDSSLVITRSITNMFKMILSKEVAIQFTAVKKVQGKLKMKDTKFYQIVEGVIKERRLESKLSVLDKDFITSLSSVLTNACNWNKILKRKSNFFEQIGPNHSNTGNRKNNMDEMDEINLQENLEEEYEGEYEILPDSQLRRIENNF